MPVTSNIKKREVRSGVAAVPYEAVKHAARVGSFTEIKGGAAISSR